MFKKLLITLLKELKKYQAFRVYKHLAPNGASQPAEFQPRVPTPAVVCLRSVRSDTFIETMLLKTIISKLL